MRRKVIVWIVLLAVLLAACGAEENPPTEPEETAPELKNTFYVLMYHSVAPDGTDCGDWTITESKFREHMQWLKDQGYIPVAPAPWQPGSLCRKRRF